MLIRYYDSVFFDEYIYIEGEQLNEYNRIKDDLAHLIDNEWLILY